MSSATWVSSSTYVATTRAVVRHRGSGARTLRLALTASALAVWADAAVTLALGLAR